MPDQMTLEQFGQKIKAKYPQYSSLSDTDIANKVIAKYPQYKSAVIEPPSTTNPNRLQPEARTAGNYAGEIARGAGRGIVNDVKGIAPLFNPLNSPVKQAYKMATGLYQGAEDAADAAQKEYDENAAAPWAKRATAAALKGLEEAPMIGGMVKSAEKGGTALASPEAAGAAAEGITTYAAPEVAAKFVGPMTRSLKETVRKGSQAAVGAGEKAVKSSVAKTAESAEESAQSVKAKNKAADETTLRKRGEVDAANEAKAKKDAETAAKDAEKRKSGKADTRAAAKTREQQVEETRAANESALREQGKIAPTREKLKAAGRELQAQIETARNKALKVGNEKYNTVNDALSSFPADGEKMVGAVEAASEKISGSNTKPAILKDMSDRVFKDESFDYNDLQGYYSELGKELSKGTLPGDVYHALDTLHESIGDEMQRIADSQGKGAQLKDARGYWRRMKQTFGKPYNPTDAGNVTLEKATGDAAEEEQANRVRLLGSFDPAIPQTVEHIGNIQKGLKSLGPEKPVREVVKNYPPAPETTRLPSGKTEATPPKQYAEPEGTTPIERPEVNTRQLREQLLDRWAKGESTMNKFQISRLASGGIGAAIGGILGHGEGATIGGIAGSAFGPAMIAKLADTPAVREWLTRPPAGELADLSKVPYADRIKIVDGLKQVADKAGIKMAPLLARMIQGGALARYPHTATNGDGHRIGSHDGQQWFDVETGATK